MGPGQTLPGIQLRLPVPLLMVQQHGQQLPGGLQRVVHRGHRLILKPQLLPPAGKVGMDGGGVLPQPLHKVGPVVNEDGPGLSHAQVKVVQSLEQGWIFRPVPQNPGLVLVEAVIFRQRGGIPGPQLADGAVQKLPPGRAPLPDEIQILGAEEDGIENPAELPGGLEPHPVGMELPPLAPEELGLQGKVPVPALNLPLEEGGVHAHHDKLPVVPGPVGPGGGQVGDGLQQIGLALGVVPVDEVHPWVEGGLQMGVVTEKVKLQALEPHVTTSSSSPSMAAVSPGRIFLPRMVQTSPLTDTRPSWMISLASPPVSTAPANFRRS